MLRAKAISTLLSTVLLTGLMAIPAPARVSAAGETVNVWMSNVKSDNTGMNLALSPQTGAVFATDSGSNPYTVYVDENTAYQTMDGFGASFTDSSAWLMYQHLRSDLNMSGAYNTLMANLFDKTNGIGLSLLRQPMGAADYARTWYSYDDMPAGQSDPNLTNFSINHDLSYVIPVVKDALNINSGRVKVMASPWSPPAWMKNNNNLNGGGDATLKSQYYGTLANYFVKFIQAYQAQGIPIWAITPQNEPGYSTSNYPSMTMDSTSQANFIANNLGPAFASNGITAKIMAYDHNWNSPGPGYIQNVYGNSTAYSYAAGAAWHWYSDDYTVAYDIHNQYPNKDMWMTEGSSGTWSPTNQWHDGFVNQIEALINYTRAWNKGIVYWNMALDENRGPNLIDDSCRGLVTIDSSTGAVTYNTDYYSMGQFSKFVDPGATHIYSNEFGNDLDTVAFKNPDGSKALVAYNVANSSKSVKVKWGNQSFTYTIPAETAVTFKWSGVQSGSTNKSAFVQLAANSYDSQSGYARPAICTDAPNYNGTTNGECLGYIGNGDYTVYKNIDFGSGAGTFTARVAANTAGTIQIRLDSPTGPIAGTLNVAATGGYQSWNTISGSVSGASGVHDLYLVYSTSGYNLNWFQFSSASSGTNLVANPGFELDGAATQTPSGWGEWQTPSASYTETKTPRSGNYNLAQYSTSAYEVATYQDLTGLPNGLYTLKAWVRSSGGQNSTYMSAKNYGGSELKATIPATNTYTQISITGINVTNGQCSITFYSNANGGNWINVDDVEFFKQ